MNIASLLHNLRILFLKHSKASNPWKIPQPYRFLSVSSTSKIEKINNLLDISHNAELDWLIIAIKLLLYLNVIDCISDDDPGHLLHLRVNTIIILVVLYVKFLYSRYYEHLLRFFHTLHVKPDQIFNWILCQLIVKSFIFYLHQYLHAALLHCSSMLCQTDTLLTSSHALRGW